MYMFFGGPYQGCTTVARLHCWGRVTGTCGCVWWLSGSAGRGRIGRWRERWGGRPGRERGRPSSSGWCRSGIWRPQSQCRTCSLSSSYRNRQENCQYKRKFVKKVHRVDDRYTSNPQSDQISFKKKHFQTFWLVGIKIKFFFHFDCFHKWCLSCFSKY